MHRIFFPDPAFGWTFFVVLIGFLAVAAYVDLRWMVVPKKISLGLLAAGILVSLVRSVWLGVQDMPLWALSTGTWWLGLLDGLLFVLAGFLFGFLLLLLMWMLGTCGGGDVKLFAGLGVWLGPRLTFWVFAASLVVMIVLTFFKFLFGGLRPLSVLKTLHGDSKKAGQPTGKLRWRMTYSFPVMVATALVLLWFCRVDLRLALSTPPSIAKVHAHAR